MLTGNASASPAPTKPENLSALWPGVTWADFSLPGNTIRYYKEDARLKAVFDYAPDLVFFMLGGNDLLNYLRDGVLNATEKAQLTDNVDYILSKIRSNLPDAKIVVLNYYDLFDTYSDQITQRDLLEYRNLSTATSESNDMMKDTANRYGCYYIDIHTPFMHHCYGRYMGDTGMLDPPFVKTPLAGFNIHPNTKGYERIYETVYTELAQLKAG
jgi:lysophospholipase L1-like esterase